MGWNEAKLGLSKAAAQEELLRCHNVYWIRFSSIQRKEYIRERSFATILSRAVVPKTAALSLPSSLETFASSRAHSAP